MILIWCPRGNLKQCYGFLFSKLYFSFEAKYINCLSKRKKWSKCMRGGVKTTKTFLIGAFSSGIAFLPSLGINSNWPNRPRDPLNREKNLFPGLVWVLSTNLNDDSSSSWKYVYWLFVCEANWDWYLLTYFRSVYVAPVQSETCIWMLLYVNHSNILPFPNGLILKRVDMACPWIFLEVDMVPSQLDYPGWQVKWIRP